MGWVIRVGKYSVYYLQGQRGRGSGNSFVILTTFGIAVRRSAWKVAAG